MGSTSASPRSGPRASAVRKSPRAGGVDSTPDCSGSPPASSSPGVLAFVFLRSADEAGTQIADTEEQAVSQVDRAYDAAAQGTMGRAIVVALSLYAESGNFTTDLATLSAYDPGLHFTSGPAKAPTTVSYAVDATGSSAPRFDRSRARAGGPGSTRDSVTTYGSGTPCTGSAAMAASAASW